MSQNTLRFPVPSGIHVGIIMDGNGRWANERHRPRAAGHRHGARAVRGVVEAAPDFGIGTLTLFAFSSDNWRRPGPEVRMLFRLFRAYLRAETEKCVREGVRLRVIGRRDRLPADLLRAIDEAEETTRAGRRLFLRVALDYSARASILEAASRSNAGFRDEEDFAAVLGDVIHDAGPAPDLDLLIRTGGEQRLSDFLLWEAAYAELYFSPRHWPDFGPDGLAEAVDEFHRRERRFGCVTAEKDPAAETLRREATG
ncbi:MAG: polyprenyl diphosphate synthase [Longimicrobiales bacterium]